MREITSSWPDQQDGGVPCYVRTLSLQSRNLVSRSALVILPDFRVFKVSDASTLQIALLLCTPRNRLRDATVKVLDLGISTLESEDGESGVPAGAMEERHLAVAS